VEDAKPKRVDWNESANFGVLLDSIVILVGNRHDCKKSCGSEQVGTLTNTMNSKKDSGDIHLHVSCPKSEPTPDYISHITGTSILGLRATANPFPPK